MVGFDLETTGVDRFVDVPVAFALVRVNAGRLVSTSAELVDAGRRVPAGATAVHGITTAQVRATGIPLATAVAYLAAELISASARGVPVVGMKLDYDLTMLDVLHRRLFGSSLWERGFRGPVLDVLVLDRHLDRFRRGKRTLVDLCAEYRVALERAHDATADARAAAEVVAAMCQRFPELGQWTLHELHALQGCWHREWATSFAAWRNSKGLSPPDDVDAAWPIAVPAVRRRRWHRRLVERIVAGFTRAGVGSRRTGTCRQPSASLGR